MHNCGNGLEIKGIVLVLGSAIVLFSMNYQDTYPQPRRTPQTTDIELEDSDDNSTGESIHYDLEGLKSKATWSEDIESLFGIFGSFWVKCNLELYGQNSEKWSCGFDHNCDDFHGYLECIHRAI